MNLQQLIQDRLRDALVGMVPDVEPYATMVKATQDAKHGDYQANCAMSLAKALGKKPRDLAQEIAGRIEIGSELEKAEVAGPGFINLRLRDDWLARQLEVIARDDRLGVAPSTCPRTFVIDFSSPNVAKPLHVGHLRSTIIGDALTRLLRFLGHRVITDNHLGDWGTQFGMLLYGYKNFRDENAYRANQIRELTRLYTDVRRLSRTFGLIQLGLSKFADREALQRTPLSELARVYALAYRCEKVEAGDVEEGQNPIAEACRLETAKLHKGDPENVGLWKEFMPACLEEINAIYHRLDVSFDKQLGESFYNPALPGVVDDLIRTKVATASQGAVVIFNSEKPDESPSVVRKSDGAFTYTATDLATIRFRMQEWKPDAVLYVVDARQSRHFQNLFAAAHRWGYEGVEFQHISFGSVLGKDRKPLSTREGGATELGALLDEAVKRGAAAYERSRREMAQFGRDSEKEARPTSSGEEAPSNEITEGEKTSIAQAVGIGAVKYADLSQNRASDYMFDWDKMLATEGNTATYMQYAYARNRSILRKASVDVQRLRTDPPPAILGSSAERTLALQLLRLEEKLTFAAADFQPSGITAYLWDLAKAYSGFFQNCPVLKAETPELRDSRLLLCDLTARALEHCLALLGIKTVERM